MTVSRSWITPCSLGGRSDMTAILLAGFEDYSTEVQQLI